MAKDNISMVSRRRGTYQSPKAELINLELPTVLCASTMRGNSTEGVTTTGFDWA